ncbi:flavodoxin domain-containing protein [Chloroflexota bacterium]
MPTKTLVAYATRYGSTKEVAEAIAQTLGESGLAVDLQPLRDVRSLDGYSAVVMGAALYMFRWHKDARKFLSRHRKALEALPVAVFALGPTHEPHDEEEWRGAREQLDKTLVKYPWFKPVAIEIMGGKYAPEKLGFPLSIFAGAEPATDIRDWEAIRAWAEGLAGKLGTGD